MRRYNYLQSKVAEYKPKTILETGTWNGNHANQMINKAIDINGLVTVDEKKTVVYYGFDLWEQMTPEIFKHEVSKEPPPLAGVSALLNTCGATIHLIQGNTLKTLPQFLKDNVGLVVDFVFIDGGHSFETVGSDWQNVQQIIDENSVVIFDDYWYPPGGKKPTFGCNRIIDSLDREKWEITQLPNSDTFPLGRVHFVEVKLKKKLLIKFKN